MIQFKSFPLISLIAGLLTLLCSCEQSGDDYRYPSVVTDYACIISDATGQADQLLLDNGSRYPISFTDELLEANKGIRPSFKADTLCRVVSVYELVATEQADTVVIASAA